MLSIKHILAPVDFSERSEAAAAEAAKLADLLGAELTFLHVGATVQVDTMYRSAAAIDQREKTQLESSRHLEGQVKALAARLAPKASAVLAEGDAATCIEEYVKNHGVDLVVIATHGRGGFRRYLLGSLTSKLLHDLSIPIATGAHLEEHPAFPGSLDNIGCALNLRDPEDAERILRWASDLGKVVDAKLTVIHVPHAADRGTCSRPPRRIPLKTLQSGRSMTCSRRRGSPPTSRFPSAIRCRT